MPPSDRRPHALYRFWDSSDVLLYIGITMNPGERWKQHRAEKPWWFEVAKVTVENYPDRKSVLDAERDAIIAEGPKYNIVYNVPLPPVGERILQLDGVKITVMCQNCRRPIVGNDGYVWIDGHALAEHERAWADHDHSRSGIAMSLAELMSLPGQVAWQAHHLRCDRDPERSSYFMHIDRLDTVAKLLDWTAHLMTKAWIDHTNWAEVIRRATEADA